MRLGRQIKWLLGSPVFIVAFAFGLRVIVLSAAWHAEPTPVKPFLPYGFEAGRVAQQIVSGRGFSSPLRLFDTGPTAWFTPVYPYLVAGVFKLWGVFSDKSRLVLETLNCAFAALTVIPIYGIGKRSFQKSVALGAAWGWVFLPTSFRFPIFWIWDTALAALFLALIFWATLCLRDSKTILPWAGYGALWATGVMINPSLLSLLPFLAGWAVWQSRRDCVSRAKVSAAILLVFVLGLIPWTIRNYRVFGRFIAFRSTFGMELWLGNNPQVTDTWTPWLNPNFSVEEGQKYQRMGEIAYMAEKQREALAFMRTHPSGAVALVFRRFVSTWLSVSDSPADIWAALLGSSFYVKTSLILNLSLPLLALFGLLFAYRILPREAAPYGMALLVFPLVFYLTHTSLRYRFPIDSILLVLAVHGLAYLISLSRERFSRQTAQTAPAPPVPTI